MQPSSRRFACTRCGQCCNRSPEVELSEAAALADVFVFRLMFRLYRQPRTPSDQSCAARNAFYERKRLLNAHAARVYPSKEVQGEKCTELTNYLMISALALDTRPGACPALIASRCSIYQRRPLTCRSVPFHYSRAQSTAERDFDAFVKTPSYRCDVSEGAPVVLSFGVITDPDVQEVRSTALKLAKSDLRWKQAIVRAMKTQVARQRETLLPTFDEVEENAAAGAMTTSMRVAWQIGQDSRLLKGDQFRSLVIAQLQTIDRELGNGFARADAAQSLAEMRVEYQHALA